MVSIGRIFYVLFAGLVFAAVFQLRYSGIDSNLYELRDDGLITMSVGRHVVDFGFVGVSPSGPIVEASSSPLQTYAYALAYALFSMSYESFGLVQTVASSFLLGAIYALLFVQAPLAGLLTVAALALGLSHVYSFFLWHGSGMENALSHVLLTATVVGPVLMIGKGQIRYWWVVPVAMTCFARIELVVTVTALLCLFSLAWFMLYRRLDALWFSACVVAFVIVGHTLRIFYFGTFFPNTAVAQSISPGDRLVALLAGDRTVFDEWLLVAKYNLFAGSWWPGVLFLPVAALAVSDKRMRFTIAAVTITLLIGLTSPFVLGLPRIEWSRTYTHVVPVLALAPGILLFLALRSKALASGLVGVAVVGVSYVALEPREPYYLGWSLDEFDPTRRTFVALADENDIQRPLVANPDLGIMSWHKNHNILDLGMLGSPVVAELARNPGIGDYFLDFARPDFVEVLGTWTSFYCGPIFLDPRFARRYEPVGPPVNLDELCAEEDPRQTIWVRRDITKGADSDERRLLDLLQDGFDRTAVSAALDACRSSNTDCSYVVRSVYRFIPEIVAAGAFDETLALFEEGVERDYLLGWRDTGAPQRVADAFRR